MEFIIFILRFITIPWMFLIPIGFWLGVRQGDTPVRRLLSGVSWAWWMWLLVAAAWGLLLWIDGLPGGWLTDPAVRTAFLATGIVLGAVWTARQIQIMLHQQRMRSSSEALAWLKEMPAGDFETLIGRYFKSFGYVVRHVGKSGDHGVDLAIYTPKEGKWIAQCKRYQNRRVGEGAVRDLYGAMMHEHADRGFIFTTSVYSQPAQAWADEKPIELIGGEELVERLNANNVRYIEKRLPPSQPMEKGS